MEKFSLQLLLLLTPQWVVVQSQDGPFFDYDECSDSKTCYGFPEGLTSCIENQVHLKHI